MKIIILILQIFLQVGVFITQGTMLKKYSKTGDRRIVWWQTMPIVLIGVIGIISLILMKLVP